MKNRAFVLFSSRGELIQVFLDEFLFGSYIINLYEMQTRPSSEIYFSVVADLRLIA